MRISQDLVALGKLMVVPRIVQERDLHDDYRKQYMKTKKNVPGKFAAADGKDLLRTAPNMEPTARDVVVNHWSVALRRGFEGCAIRRTMETLDIDGKPISGLPPMHSEVIMIKLRDEEQEAINKLAVGEVSNGRTNLVSSFTAY